MTSNELKDEDDVLAAAEVIRKRREAAQPALQVLQEDEFDIALIKPGMNREQTDRTHAAIRKVLANLNR